MPLVRKICADRIGKYLLKEVERSINLCHVTCACTYVLASAYLIHAFLLISAITQRLIASLAFI